MSFFEPYEAHTRYETLLINFLDMQTDAGGVALHVQRALDSLEAEVITESHPDAQRHYRFHRPYAHLHNGRLEIEDIDTVFLAAVHDLGEKSFLYLGGEEPDVNWMSIAEEILELIEKFGVRHVYTFRSIGAPAPHTRPADMFIRSTRQDVNVDPLPGDFLFEANFSDFVESLLVDKPVTLTHFTVRVPVYLASNPYPSGAAALISELSHLTGLRLPVGDVEAAAASMSETLAQAVKENPEFAAMVENIESSYDESIGNVPGLIQARNREERVPSLDEIGKAAEEFLQRVMAENEGNEESGSATQMISHIHPVTSSHSGYASLLEDKTYEDSEDNKEDNNHELPDEHVHTEKENLSNSPTGVKDDGRAEEAPRVRKRGKHAWIDPAEQG